MIKVDWVFSNCVVTLYPPDYLETIFPDGRVCPALFTGTEQNVAHAKELGYGESLTAIRRMHFEHELSHTVLAEAMGLPYSPVLAHVAGVAPCPDDQREREEGLVMAFQRFLNDGTRASILDDVPDLDGVAAHFTTRFRRTQGDD